MSEEKNTEKGWEEEFVEQGADIEHDRWARWQKHMFSKGTVNKDGSLTIPAGLVERWFRQIDTKYQDLSEEEKESDRKETRAYLPIVSQVEARAREEARREILTKDIEEMEGLKQTRPDFTLAEAYDGQNQGDIADAAGRDSRNFVLTTLITRKKEALEDVNGK